MTEATKVSTDVTSLGFTQGYFGFMFDSYAFLSLIENIDDIL
jgi:hypothetical protein